MAVSIIQSLSDLEISIKGFSPKLNINSWELLLQPRPQKTLTLGAILHEINKIVFKMRCSKQFDESTALELLINLFLTKSFYPSSKFTHTSLTCHLSILMLLLGIESTGNQRKMSEVSWRLLKYTFKSQLEDFRWKAPSDLFEETERSRVSFLKVGAKDHFHHKLGRLTADETYSDSRFGMYEKEFQRNERGEGLELGKKFENHQSDWFENTTGELFGAFLHLQIQDKNNPFSIALKLPPLSTAKSPSVYPFPCVNEEPKKAKGNNKLSCSVNWQDITSAFAANYNLPLRQANVRKKQLLWEKHEKSVKIQGILPKLDTLYEKNLRTALDANFFPNENPMSSTEFMWNVKNLILGIPNQLFDTKTYQKKSRFRLQSHSHLVLCNFLTNIVKTSQSFKFLSNLIKELNAKQELISPSFAKGLSEILSFFENYLLQLPPDMTIIQFNIQTQNLREQIDSLKIVCTNIPQGVGLIDYLYVILTKNEGDFENYHLLQKLFKNIIQPVLNTLTEFVFSSEINDIHGDFVLQYNEEAVSAQEFTHIKYFNYFKSSQNIIFTPVIEYLLNIGRNLHLLKQLDSNLSSYYQFLSTASLSSLSPMKLPIPRFRLSYKSSKISRIAEEFIAFNGEQTNSLLALERKILEEEQLKDLLLFERKQKQIQSTKLISAVQKRLQQEKIEEKHRKQWNFYQVLEQQLKENQELKTLIERKRAEEEAKAQEKVEQEQREIIEKGKQYLIQRHEDMVNELYMKRALENWKKKREELTEKRIRFWMEEEIRIDREFKGLMDLDSIESSKQDNEELPRISHRVNQSTELDLKPLNVQILREPWINRSNSLPLNTDIEKKLINSEPVSSQFPTHVRQPPGGSSTIQDLFNYTLPKESPIEIVQNRSPAYKEDLEKLEICSALLWEEILRKVFRKITPKKLWEIAPKPESSKTFDELFPGFSYKDRTVDISVPFSKVLEKLIVEPIKMQSEIVNKACVHLFLRKLKLINHLKALKRYALLEAGDTIDMFLSTIFSMSFSGNMTAAWESCLKMSSSRDDEYGEFFRISIKSNNLYRIQFKTVEDIELLAINYAIKGPLELIISPDRIHQYGRAFCSLLRVKHVTSILSNIKIFRVPANHIYYRKIHLLRQKMQHFLDIYQGYIASELHGSSWKFLMKSIAKATNIEEIMKSHKEYLDIVMTRCFLEGNGKVVMEQLKMIFQLVMRFRNIVMEMDEFALREIEMIEEDFNSIHRFLFKMTQTMAAKGNYPELFLRLDFNEFMTNKIDRERQMIK